MRVYTFTTYHSRGAGTCPKRLPCFQRGYCKLTDGWEVWRQSVQGKLCHRAGWVLKGTRGTDIDNSAMQCLHNNWEDAAEHKSSTNLLRLCHSRKTEGYQPNKAFAIDNVLMQPRLSGRASSFSTGLCHQDARMGVMRKEAAHETFLSKTLEQIQRTVVCNSFRSDTERYILAPATSRFTIKDVRRKFRTIPP